MKIIAKTGNTELATIYIAQTNDGNYVEFVESIQPPHTLDKKWVLIVSTLYGCPVGCAFCDCSYFYKGKISTEDIFNQIDSMVLQRFPDRKITVEKFKIQFARMGEPSLNNNVLVVLNKFSDYYDAPGFVPSLSSIAPASSEDFFEELLLIKKRKYRNNFQLQFSIHSTNEAQRDEFIPVKK
ncbi:radical SAM protein, partial [Bacteroidetes/Chlorobi group bacterium ChocPot_Mid]